MRPPPLPSWPTARTCRAPSARWVSRPCAKNGWSRIAGGPPPRSGAATSSSRSTTGAAWWSFGSSRAAAGTRSGRRTVRVGYVELHCHSAYSFLDGASSPAELAATAAAHGHDALAITDHDGLWGAMEFAHACKGVGVRPITGAEVTVEDPAPHRDPFHLTLLVEDAVGYRNLCRLLTEAHRGTRSSEPGKAGGRADEVVTRPEGAARTRPRRDREPLPPTVTLEDVERLAG